MRATTEEVIIERINYYLQRVENYKQRVMQKYWKIIERIAKRYPELKDKIYAFAQDPPEEISADYLKEKCKGWRKRLESMYTMLTESLIQALKKKVGYKFYEFDMVYENLRSAFSLLMTAVGFGEKGMVDYFKEYLNKAKEYYQKGINYLNKFLSVLSSKSIYTDLKHYADAIHGYLTYFEQILNYSHETERIVKAMDSAKKVIENAPSDKRTTYENRINKIINDIKSNDDYLERKFERIKPLLKRIKERRNYYLSRTEDYLKRKFKYLFSRYKYLLHTVVREKFPELVKYLPSM